MDNDSESLEQKQISPDKQETPEESTAEQPVAESETRAEKQDVPALENAAEKEADQEAPALLDLGAPKETQAMNLPPETFPATCPAGPLGRIFDALSYAGPLVLLVLCVLMTCAEVLQLRELWFSDEVRLADVLLHLRQGDWLVLALNGAPYADKPPLYFWAMYGLTLIPGVSVAMAVFLAVAVSHALFVLSVWGLARGTGHDKRVALAAGLLTLCCVYVSGAACYPRMDLLFSALIVFAMTCLYRGWIRPNAPCWLGAGFLLLGLATLVKGPLGIGFALAASIVFLLWRGTPGRLNGRDGLPGFALMLVLILAWLGVLAFKGETAYLYEMIGVQLLGRMTGGAPHSYPWWYYLAALPLMWLPWVFLVLFVDWISAVRGFPAAWKNRKANGGSCWLWIWLFSGVVILSVIPSKIAVYALPLLAPLAVLTARSLLKLSPARSRWFFRLTAILLLAAGFALIAADLFPFVRDFLPENWMPVLPPAVNAWLEALHGAAVMGGILALAAVLLLALVCLDHPGGALLLTAVGMVAIAIPYELLVAPGLGAILSPRAQAEAMLEKVKDGYAPAAFKVYRGAYAWHLNQLAKTSETLRTAPDLKDAATRDAWLAQNPKAVIAMPEKEWEAWQDKPATASVILRTWMVDKPYVVAAMDVTPPAPRQEEESAARSAPAASPESSPNAAEQAGPGAPATPSEPAENPNAAEQSEADAAAPDAAAPAPTPEQPAVSF